MTIKALYPTIRPTLNLDFAKTKALDPRVTFSRASSATFVDVDGLIKSAATNVPRFDHNPTTGESLGLLVEEARTNECLRSEELSDTGSWSRTAVNVTANAAISPAGTLTADTIIPNTSNTNHILVQFVLSAGQTYSLFVKPAGYNFVVIGDGSATWNASFNLVNATATILNGSVTAGITALAGGWFRIFGTVSATTNNQFRIFVHPTGTSGYELFAGDGVSGVHVWGTQVEAGSFPTSYIPTTSATVTRAADVASITGANFSSWYNQDAGTMYVEDRGTPSFGTGGKSFVIGGANSTFSRLGMYSSGSAAFDSFAPGLDQDVNYITGANNAIKNKHAAGLADNNTSYYKDGVLIGTDTSCKISGRNMQNVAIGNNIAALARLNGTIFRLTYWPTRLPNATLQAITR